MTRAAAARIAGVTHLLYVPLGISALPISGRVCPGAGAGIPERLASMVQRMVPSALAGVGVFASGLLMVVYPLQMAGFIGGHANFAGWLTWVASLPVLAFELSLAFWLIFKGVKPAQGATPGLRLQEAT